MKHLTIHDLIAICGLSPASVNTAMTPETTSLSSIVDAPNRSALELMSDAEDQTFDVQYQSVTL